jgi:AraC-like DNA-binding protein
MASHPSTMPANDPRRAGDAAAAALRADAEIAIAVLGDRAAQLVPVGSLTYFGSRLGWPDWLYAGSSLAGLDGPPPAQIALADDLMISANLYGHVGAAELATQMVRAPQPAAGAVTRLALGHAPTLGDIFGFLGRLTRLGSPHCRPVLRVDGDVAFVGIDADVPLGGLLDHVALLFIGFHYRVLEDLVFADAAAATIRLTMPEDGSSAAIRQLFAGAVHFGAAANRLEVPATWLANANPGHDAPLWALAGERMRAAEAIAADAYAVRHLRGVVADILSRDCRAPRLKQVAQAEGLSTRTLVRLLANGGHSFHGLVDDERRLRAAQLINDPSLSLRAIAGQLGFPDVSSFGRKFRQWFGDSPGHFRRDRA